MKKLIAIMCLLCWISTVPGAFAQEQSMMLVAVTDHAGTVSSNTGNIIKPEFLFNKTKPICTLGGSDPKTITCKEQVFMGACELFNLGMSSLGKEEQSKYACAEYPDPLPAAAVVNTPNTYCIVVDRGGTEKKLTIVSIDAALKQQYKNCDAIAIKAGGGFTLIFNFVSYIFFVVQPLLISVAVVYIIIIGLEIMYAGGSPADVQKKIKEKLINVLSGLTLLFLIKLILVTINGAFFVN